MADNIPQWPFIPAIEGKVPLPRPDPRSAQDKSLAFAKALMATKAAPPAVPMPKPDPRDWANRSIIAGDESGTAGAIHPDALMNARGIQPPSGHSVDKMQWEGYPGRGGMPPNQIPLGMPQPAMEQGAGLFGVPPQQLQQMAAAKPPDQNLPKIPQFGFSPTLSPMYMNDTHPMSKPPAPNQPPVFWQPG